MTDPRPPAELARFVKVIGDEATLALIEAHGGLVIHIPRFVWPETVLTRSIGTAAAEALAAEYGGEKLRIPIAKNWRARVYRRRGETIAAIARRLSVGENTVYDYVSRDRLRNGIPGQRDLFG